MKRIILIILLCVTNTLAWAQNYVVTKDIEVYQITEQIYMYTAWSDIENWGRVGSNGLIVADNGEALLVDTPMTESQTKELARWIGTELGCKITQFVPTHWHSDCVGGMDWLNKQDVESYALRQTNKILKSKGKPCAKRSFDKSKELTLGLVKVECYYLGGGHATDNIVVWLPGQRVLFGGCMLKDADAQSIGNTEDAAPLKQWMQTVTQVERKFPQAQLIIPGHGSAGGKEIFERTKELLKIQN